LGIDGSQFFEVSTVSTKKPKKAKKAKKAEEKPKVKEETPEAIEDDEDELITDESLEELPEDESLEDLIQLEEKKGEEPELEELLKKKAERREAEPIIEERLYTVPLGRTRNVPHYKRSKKAVTILREFLMRHLKPEELVIAPELNEYIWSRGVKNPPRKVKIRTTKTAEGLVTAYLIKS